MDGFRRGLACPWCGGLLTSSRTGYVWCGNVGFQKGQAVRCGYGIRPPVTAIEHNQRYPGPGGTPKGGDPVSQPQGAIAGEQTPGPGFDPPTDPRSPPTGDRVPRCRVCGCTDADCSGCIARTGVPCHWIAPDLCSACADAEVVKG